MHGTTRFRDLSIQSSATFNTNEFIENYVDEDSKVACSSDDYDHRAKAVANASEEVKEEDNYNGNHDHEWNNFQIRQDTTSPVDNIASIKNESYGLLKTENLQDVEVDDFAEGKDSSKFAMATGNEDLTKDETEMESTFDLPSATAEAMETYETIKSNIYLGSANGRSIASESMPCECKYEPGYDDSEAACGNDNACINRMMFMECIADDCPCGRYCQNRRFQLRQYARVDVIRTEKKGYGLRALTDLPSNTFIMEYVGEVISNSEFVRRTRMYELQGIQHYYFMTLKTDEIIDATKKGCLARFINHSCNPNCVTQKWVVGKSMRIGLFTARPVKAGEELTFDYKFERYGAAAQVCYCGEPNCKGFIGGAIQEEEEQAVSRMQYIEDYEEQERPGLKRKRGRPRSIQPLHDVEQVLNFVKQMLDSVGKAALVKKLLQRLELTNPDHSIGRDVLRKFVRLHGLKMLKFWLGEWKNDEEIVEKVLLVLQKLPLSNRNGLDDADLFTVLQKFIESDNESIRSISRELLSTWDNLKTVYRIPKRINTESAPTSPKTVDDDSLESSARDTKTASSRKPNCVGSRAYFDPDDDYYDYLPLDSDLNEAQVIMRFPPQPAVPRAPRAMIYWEPAVNSGGWQQYLIDHYQEISYPEYYVSYDIQNAYAGVNVPRMPLRRLQGTTDSYETHATLATRPRKMKNASAQEIYPTPGTESNVVPDGPKLPLNWRYAVTEDGKTYYYNVITRKSQWHPPDERMVSEEEVQEGRLNDISPQTEGSVQRRYQPGASASPATSIARNSPHVLTPSASTNESNDVEGPQLDEVELKKEVGKVVTKYLTVKQRDLWHGDKQLFKELARKLTHHVVHREMQSKRKIKGMTSALRAKIENFMEMHGAEFAAKLDSSHK